MGKWTDAAIERRQIYDKAAGFLTDAEALSVKGVYWQWEDLVQAGTTVDKGYRFRYGDKLWRTEQPKYTFVEHYIPGAQGMESLFSVIDESHAGTYEDPIPYDRNMEIHAGLYYIEHGITYLCTRSSGQPLYNDLSVLVGHFVEVAK